MRQREKKALDGKTVKQYSRYTRDGNTLINGMGPATVRSQQARKGYIV
jgi:hypothetical protein